MHVQENSVTLSHKAAKDTYFFDNHDLGEFEFVVRLEPLV